MGDGAGDSTVEDNTAEDNVQQSWLPLGPLRLHLAASWGIERQGGLQGTAQRVTAYDILVFALGLLRLRLAASWRISQRGRCTGGTVRSVGGGVAQHDDDMARDSSDVDSPEQPWIFLRATVAASCSIVEGGTAGEVTQ